MNKGIFQAVSIVFATLLTPPSLSAQSCGDLETPCIVEGGTYHVLLPETPEPMGIVMHLHGGGSTGSSMLNSDLASEALSRSYVFVAPNGEHPEARWTKDWSVRADSMKFEREDAAFLSTVLADVQIKTDLAEAPLLLSGFSRGGSMVWDMACWQPDFADAYAALAGAFWEQLPDHCAERTCISVPYAWMDGPSGAAGRAIFL